MREVSFVELLRSFVGSDDADEIVQARATLRRKVAETGATALVLFENVQMDSQSLGSKTVLAIGPDCTYQDIEDVEDKHLGDLPSQREYPQMWCSADWTVLDEPTQDALVGLSMAKDAMASAFEHEQGEP